MCILISTWLSELARPIKILNYVEFVEEFRLKRDLMNIQSASLAVRDTAHAQRQFPMWEEISAHNIEFGNKKRITIWNERAIHGLF